MSRFFIGRPIVAIVISILMVLLGLVALLQLPVSLYPNIAPPEILVQATYVGADALTLEKSVAAPIEQQMTGVAKMLYMYSSSASNGGQMNLRVDFDVTTDPSTDQVLAQMRSSQATAQLPPQVQEVGVTVRKSASSPLALFTMYSPKGTFDQLFISNYAYININDPMTRVPGIGQVQIFGAGQYAMRVWMRPDALAKLEITTNDVISAIQAQSAANAAGQIGSNPVPPGQEFAYTVRTSGRLEKPEDFGNIVVRARPDGAVVRVRDVARVELGAQNYTIQGRLNGKPATVIAVYQLPGSNALQTVKRARALMEEAKTRFPEDLDYVVSLDTTLAVTAGIEEIVKTLFEALALVIVVVFVFLQGFRATLIPLLAVPVSLVGTFAVFPLLGFSINTLSLFGLVLAIGLVVDDAIVVVEAVEHHIEGGMTPRDATLKAMEEVAGPVVAIALILVAVFVPTAFVPGITGRMYQQFAVTIAVSVVISAFNALTLSPALAAMLLRPRKPVRGPLGVFFRGFNRWFGRATDGYVKVAAILVRRTAIALILLLVVGVMIGGIGHVLPKGFIPPEDLGYIYLNVQLPPGSSLERTAAVSNEVDRILASTPGVKYYTGVMGFSLLSTVFTTYNAFYFVTLDPWAERVPKNLGLRYLLPIIRERFAKFEGAEIFPFPPPTIPGVGSSGGVTFVLEDRTGKDVEFLAKNTKVFMEEASKRREFMMLMTTLLPSVPQVFADVDRDKVLRQTVEPVGGLPDAPGVPRRVLRELLQPLRSRVAGLRRGGRAGSRARRRHRSLLRAQRRRHAGAAVLLRHHASELRPRVHAALQRVPLRPDQRDLAARRQQRARHEGARGSLRQDHARGDGLRLHGHVVPAAGRRQGRADQRHLRRLVPGCLPHPRGPVRELVPSPRGAAQHAHCGVRRLLRADRPPLRGRRVFRDRPRDAHRAGGKERHPDRRVQQGRARARRVDRRRRARRRAPSPPADPDDRARVHPRRRAALCRHGFRRGLAARPRHHGLRRHARGDLHRRLRSPGHVRADPAPGVAAHAGARADRSAGRAIGRALECRFRLLRSPSPWPSPQKGARSPLTLPSPQRGSTPLTLPSPQRGEGS